MSQITITQFGDLIEPLTPKYLKNPYKHIPSNKLDDNSLEWSSALYDLKSTTHLHVTQPQHIIRAINKGYDHIAISNYHASKPTIPISEKIKELSGYNENLHKIPENWLESPNSEHVYFQGTSNTHIHMNSLGSYATSGTDNTGVNEGGFNGDIPEFIAEVNKLFKYSNGGGITINHPYWSGMSADDVINIKNSGDNVIAIEIYNAASEGNKEAAQHKGYSLDIWDEILAKGIQIYGIAVPDHAAEGSAQWDWETIGFGFNHMLCMTKTEQEILLAYRQGRFYSTIYNDDLLLKYFNIDDSGLITIKSSKTGDIKFKTALREVIVNSTSSASFQTQVSDIYVRAEIASENNRLFTNAIIL